MNAELSTSLSRRVLVRFLEICAATYASRAEEDDDETWRRSRDGYVELVRIVESLPSDDERLMRLAIARADFDESLEVGNHTRSDGSAFRVNDPTETPAAFIDRLVDAMIADSLERDVGP